MNKKLPFKSLLISFLCGALVCTPSVRADTSETQSQEPPAAEDTTPLPQDQAEGLPQAQADAPAPQDNSGMEPQEETDMAASPQDDAEMGKAAADSTAQASSLTTWQIVGLTVGAVAVATAAILIVSYHEGHSAGNN